MGRGAGVVNRLIDEAGLSPYEPPPAWLVARWARERKKEPLRRRKPPLFRRYKVFYPYVVVQELTGGGYSVKAYEETDLIARVSGLERYEADKIYDAASDVLWEESRG